MKQIIEYFNLDPSAITHKRIPLKEVLGEIEPTVSERRILECSIESIYLEAVLDTSTTRIRSFKDETYYYETIYIILTNLKSYRNFSLVNEKLQSVFQNPVIVIYQYKDEIVISGSKKRISRSSNDKSVIDEIIKTKAFKVDIEHELYLRGMDLNEFSHRDLKDYYESILDKLSSESIIHILNKYPERLGNIKIICELLKKYESSSSTFQSLQESYKRESMMSRKLNIHSKMQELLITMNVIKDEIKREIENGKN